MIRSGTDKCLGCRNTDEGYLDSGRFLDHIGIKYEFSFTVKVTAYIWEFSLFCKIHESIHSVIKFVIAGDGNIIMKIIHKVDYGFAFGDGSYRLALY